MRNILIFILGVCSQVQAGDAGLEKLKASMLKAGNSCKDITTGFGIVRTRGPKGAQRFELFKGGKIVKMIPAPTFGTQNESCLDVQYFPKHEILLFRVFKGTSSPAAIESTVLLAVKVKESELNYLREFVILETDDEDTITELKNFKLSNVEGDVTLTLEDQLDPTASPEEISLVGL